MPLLYVSWDGDSIGARAGLARMHDDVVEVRRVSQAIDGGNEIWKAFALRSGGSVVEAGGDEGAIEIDAGHLAEVPDIIRQYSELVGATVTVGIGLRLSESSKAVLIGKLRGKNQTVLWAPDMADELAAARPKSEAEKIGDAYLMKSQVFHQAAFRHLATGEIVGTGAYHDPEQLPGGEDSIPHFEAGFLDKSGKFYTRQEATKVLHSLRPARSEDVVMQKAQALNAAAHLTGGIHDNVHAGFSGHKQPSRSRPGSKGQEDHSAASVAEDAAQTGSDQPEQTHAAEDFEESLHSAAGAQDKKDRDSTIQDDQGLDQMKKKLVAVLGQVRAQMPALVQLKQAAPDTYQTIMNLVSGVIMLGKQVMKGQPAVADEDPQHVKEGLQPGAPTSKSEQLEKKVGDLPAGKQTAERTRYYANGYNEFRHDYDYSHLLPAPAQREGVTLSVRHFGLEKPGHKQGETITAHLHHPKFRGYGGTVTGHVKSAADTRSGQESIEPHSELEEDLRGQGLGKAMYESVFAHAKHVVGIDRVEGGRHSADADHLHQALARKHGFEYQAAHDPRGHLDEFPYGNYAYALKGELEDQIPEDKFIGPGKGIIFSRSGVAKEEMASSPASGPELDKAAGAKGGIEGHPQRAHLTLPPGSVHDQEMKVTHADGKTGWISMQSGAIQGQEPGVPLIGPNSHPVSSRKPSAR